MGNLPSEYQEVKYIQSSGTQYIDTGFIPTNNTKVKLSMGGFSGTGASNCLFGARASRNADASIGRGLQFSVNATTTPRDYGGMFGRNYGPQSGMTSGMFSWANGGNYILEVSQSGFYENGVNKLTPQAVTFTSPVNLYIFSNNTNGTISEITSFKLYYFEVYESGTLVRDFIPCYRKSDNVIGLYDLVNNQFYTNSGTGTFTKGSDVKGAKIQRIYIGSNLVRPEGWQPGANTLAYRPLTSTTTVNDQSGNNRNLTNTGSVTFGTYKGVDCAYFSGSNYLRISTFPSNLQQLTIACWIYYISNGYTSNGNYDQVAWWWGSNFGVYRDCYNSPYNQLRILGALDASSKGYTLSSDSGWLFVVGVYDYNNRTSKSYVNGSQFGTRTSYTATEGTVFTIGNNQNSNNGSYKKWKGGISELIVENKVRTDQEIAKYFNRTKSKYGIS